MRRTSPSRRTTSLLSDASPLHPAAGRRGRPAALDPVAALVDPLQADTSADRLPHGAAEHCEDWLAQCAEACEAAMAAGIDDGALASAIAECSLLCRTVQRADSIGARTTRELKLICAAVCHLVSEECAQFPAAWAADLAHISAACAEACREVSSLGIPVRRAGGPPATERYA